MIYDKISVMCYSCCVVHPACTSRSDLRQRKGMNDDVQLNMEMNSNFRHIYQTSESRR